mgnify:CR=1 FL=1
MAQKTNKAMTAMSQMEKLASMMNDVFTGFTADVSRTLETTRDSNEIAMKAIEQFMHTQLDIQNKAISAAISDYELPEETPASTKGKDRIHDTIVNIGSLDLETASE